MKLYMDTMTSKLIFEENEEYLIPIVHKAMHTGLGVKQDGYIFSPAYKSGYWDGIIDFFDKETNSFHTGLAPQVDAILGKLQAVHPFTFSIEDDRPDPFMDVEDLPNDIVLYGDGEENITLRDYQYDAVAQVIDQQVGIVEIATNGVFSSAYL